jgi:hypothetical protein
MLVPAPESVKLPRPPGKGTNSLEGLFTLAHKPAVQSKLKVKLKQTGKKHMNKIVSLALLVGGVIAHNLWD